MIPLAQIAAHLRVCYPAEGCGLVFEDASGTLSFAPIPNVAGDAQARGITSRTQVDGYLMDPKAQMRALDEADRTGGRLYAIVHSHPDVGAYFSKEDRAKALDDAGDPVWPGVRYLVVSVRSGSVDGARLYTWDAGQRDFLEVDVPEIVACS